MRMRDLIDLVEAFDVVQQLSINQTAVNTYGTQGGSGALAIAVFDASDWQICKILNREGKVLYWVNRLPNGALVDIYGAYNVNAMRARFGNDITISPVSRADAFDSYQNDAPNKIPVQSAKSYVNAVIQMGKSGSQSNFTPPTISSSQRPQDNQAQIRKPRMTRKGIR